MSATSSWPTLGSTFKSWDATCNHCGENFPPETRINAAWSSELFYISCRCSPAKWVPMAPATQAAGGEEGS